MCNKINDKNAAPAEAAASQGTTRRRARLGPRAASRPAPALASIGKRKPARGEVRASRAEIALPKLARTPFRGRDTERPQTIEGRAAIIVSEWPRIRPEPRLSLLRTLFIRRVRPESPISGTFDAVSTYARKSVRVVVVQSRWEALCLSTLGFVILRGFP